MFGTKSHYLPIQVSLKTSTKKCPTKTTQKSLFWISESLSHTHVGFPQGIFNLNFPTSIPVTFIWESAWFEYNNNNRQQQHNKFIQQNRTQLYGHPLNTDTSLLRTVFPGGQFSLSKGKALTFFLNSTRFNLAQLIRTPVNEDNGHLFLAQSTRNSYRKPTSLMPTLHYNLCAVIDLSFWMVRNPTVDSMSMLPALQYTG